MLAGTCLLPVPNPPSLAHASAAGAVARNFTNASIAGVSLNVTSRSPPISTAPAFAPGVIDGNGTALKPVFGFAFVDDRITPATKSPSNTVAAFGGLENAFVTESLKLYCSAPLVPPARLLLSPRTWPIVVNAFLTLESVHLTLCAVRASYFAGPYVRR